MTDQQFQVLNLRVFQDMTMDKVADVMGISRATASARLAEALQAARLAMEGSPAPPPPPKDQSRWMTPEAFAEAFTITIPYLRTIMNPKLTRRHSPYHIRPQDISLIQGGRIRYLEGPEGLIYPKFVKRTEKQQESGNPQLKPKIP
jgi:hypothetical protein